MRRGRQIAVAVLLAVLVLPAAAQARSFGSRTLERGDHGRDVKTLQRLLGESGFETALDGAFGRGTQKTVKAWEGAGQRTVDGRFTRADARELRIDAAGGPSDPLEDDPVDEAEPAAEAGETATDDGSSGGTGYVEVEAAVLNDDGTATAPAGAPAAVQAIIAGGNAIHDKPYRYGGGHGRGFKDSAYDCSGSMSYALHEAGLLKRPLASGGFESWGDEGPGTWVSVYANAGHAYLVVAGLRYDTSGAKSRSGSRWTDELRPDSGYVVRHPPGL